MTDCCTDAACVVEKLQARQASTLKVVLVINAGMFLLEFAAGLFAASTALLADSLDMFGDALVYGFSLYVVSRNDWWKAVSAVIKGGLMALFGLFVLGQATYKFFNPAAPQFETIGVIGLLALAANGVCLLLLWRHRAEDVNMRSVWLCSRNDIIANVSVILAGLGVWLTGSQLPDLLVGLGIAVLFLRTAFHVFQDSEAAFTTYNQSLHQIANPHQ